MGGCNFENCSSVSFVNLSQSALRKFIKVFFSLGIGIISVTREIVRGRWSDPNSGWDSQVANGRRDRLAKDTSGEEGRPFSLGGSLVCVSSLMVARSELPISSAKAVPRASWS